MKMFKSVSLLFCFFCLIACGLIGPYRDLEIAIITRYQYVDIMLFDMPDSAKVFNGTYDLNYHPNSTIHLSNIPNGIYLLRIEASENESIALDTLILYEGKKSILVELNE